MNPILTAVLIILIALAVGGLILLGIVLFNRHRGKHALWFRVNGTVVSTKKCMLPGTQRFVVLYTDPTTRGRVPAVTCPLDKHIIYSKGPHAFNLCVYKSITGKTVKRLYPPNKKEIIKPVRMKQTIRK